MVDGAEPCSGDDNEREAERNSEIGDRPGLAKWNEQPAGTLDEQSVASERHRFGLLDDLREADLLAGLTGRDERCERLFVGVGVDHLVGGLEL